MKFLCFLIVIALVSCKKKYTCNCYSDRRGFIELQETYHYKEREKSVALSKCRTDYENSGNYGYGYCEIK
jgi:hypothetical protein